MSFQALFHAAVVVDVEVAAVVVGVLVDGDPVDVHMILVVLAS